MFVGKKRTPLVTRVCLGAVAGFAVAVSAHGTLYELSTVRGSLNGTTDPPAPADNLLDRYDPAAVTVVTAANMSGPDANEIATDGTDGSGIVELQRFWNGEFPGSTFPGWFHLTRGGTGVEVLDFTRDYWAFTLTADPGFVLNLEDIEFQSARGGSSGRRGFELYAEVNGGTFDASDLIVDVDDEAGTRNTPNLRSALLTDAKFQGVTSVEFRYYPLPDLTGRSIEFTNLVVDGAVVVPEPASLTLAAAGLGLVGLRRRRA